MAKIGLAAQTLHLEQRAFGPGTTAFTAHLPAFTASGAGTIKLRLLETTDIHVYVLPYDYYQDLPDDTVGIARTASLIAKARGGARNSLLFDNGDFLQGNPMGDLMAYQHGLKWGDVHPAIAAMNLLKVDVGTLGNHEFNYGLPFLEKALAGAAFPLVCANLIKGSPASSPRNDQTFIPPYLILERDLVDEAGAAHLIKIGVIGFLPPQIMQWDHANLAGRVDTRDIVETATAYLPQMREAGCDLIVCLAHTGISAVAPVGRDENAALHLARVSGIDVIFTGHSHLEFPNRAVSGNPFAGHVGIDPINGRLNGIPAVMAGFWGSHLGQVDLTLRIEAGVTRVNDAHASLLPIFCREGALVRALVCDDISVINRFKPMHAATLAFMARPIGVCVRRLSTYFALVSNTAALHLISMAQSEYARTLLQVTPFAKIPLLSAVAPFKCGGRAGPRSYSDMPAGEIALKNAADLYLYPNLLKAVQVNGAQLQDWLEHAAGQFNQIFEGAAEQQLLNNDFPGFNFDVISGVTYTIDVGQPARFDMEGQIANIDAHRITNLCFQGEAVQPSDEFVIVTNNYRASGGGQFAGADGTTIVLDAPDTIRDILIRYIQEMVTVDPVAPMTWSFAAMPSTTNVVFETGPKARDCLALMTGLTDLGDTPAGFAKFRITLGLPQQS